MPTFKLEEMDENQPYGGDNDMYFRQWRLPSMKPVLDEKLDRDFLDAVAKKDEMMRKRAERRQKHSEQYDRKFQSLVQKMSEASVKESKPQEPVFRKPTDAEMRKARDDLEREFASPSSTAKMVPFKGNVRPRQNPIFGEKMVSMKSLVLPSSSSSVPTSSKESNANFGAHETVFYPQTHDSFNLDHYNGSRPSFAFAGIQGATSTPVSAKSGAFFKTGIPEEDGDDSVFESSKYVTAMESPMPKSQKEDLEAKKKELQNLESEAIRQKALVEEEKKRIQKTQEDQRVIEKEEKANSGRFGKGNPIFEKKTNAFGSIFGQKLTQMEEQQQELGAASSATNPPGLSSIFGGSKPAPIASTAPASFSTPSSIFSTAQNTPKPPAADSTASSIFSTAQNTPKPPSATDSIAEKPLISSIFTKKQQPPQMEQKQETVAPPTSLIGSAAPSSIFSTAQNAPNPSNPSGTDQKPLISSIFGKPASLSPFSAAQNAPKPVETTKEEKPLISSIFGKKAPSDVAQNAPKPSATTESKDQKPLISSIFGSKSPPTSSPETSRTSEPEASEPEGHPSRPMGIPAPPPPPPPTQQKAPTRPYALFKNYIALLAELQNDKKAFETASDPHFRALLKRTITERVTVFTERQTSADARAEILEFFKTMLQKSPVRGFAVVGEAPIIRLEKDEEVNYAVHCLVEKYISLAELDEELAPTISDLVSRLAAVVRRVEKVFIVLMFNKSTLLRQNPEECLAKFVGEPSESSSTSADEKAIEWNQERALVVLFFTVFAKNALISQKGRKMVLSDELLWKYAETSISEIFEVPKAAFVLLQLITTCKPRLHLDEDRWYDMLDTIDTEILPELETNHHAFPGDEAIISQLAWMVAHLKEQEQE